MKTILLFVAFICICLPLSSEEPSKKPVVWLTDYDEAIKASKENKKDIFLVFSGSDWCVNCIKLKKNVLSTPAFESFAVGQFNLLVLDFPSNKANALPEKQVKKNEAIAEKYNKDGAFPLCILLNSEGKVVGEIKSYTNESPEKYIQMIKDLQTKKQ